MDPNDTGEIGLYMAGEADYDGNPTWICLGFWPQDELRVLISRKEAKVQKWPHGERRVVLTSTALASQRVRSLSLAGATQALSTTYTEDLYPDTPAQLAWKKENGVSVTVTASAIAMKRTLRNRQGVDMGFAPWQPTEGFRRKRFNPDLLKPLYPTVRAAMLAKSQA